MQSDFTVPIDRSINITLADAEALFDTCFFMCSVRTGCRGLLQQVHLNTCCV